MERETKFEKGDDNARLVVSFVNLDLIILLMAIQLPQLSSERILLPPTSPTPQDKSLVNCAGTGAGLVSVGD